MNQTYPRAVLDEEAGISDDISLPVGSFVLVLLACFATTLGASCFAHKMPMYRARTTKTMRAAPAALAQNPRPVAKPDMAWDDDAHLNDSSFEYVLLSDL